MNDFVIPMPDYLKKYEKEVSNFGLRFQKFFPYVNDELKITRTVNKESVESLHRLCTRYSETGTAEIKVLLQRKNDRYKELREQQISLGADILKITAKLASRLVTGIGEPTPAEVGMVFDRNLGIPYIPASSIKGAVSYAYCVNYVNEAGPEDHYVKIQNGKSLFNPDEPGFKSLFGARESKEASRGGFAFMDAYPDSRPEIVMEIMNPHFGSYYRGENPPSETDNPVPIKFLAVEKGLTFDFGGYFIKKESQRHKQALFNAFKTALKELGLGAKTATGYGLFEAVEDKSDQLKDNVRNKKKSDREKKEDLERKAKEADLEKAKQEKKEQEKRIQEEIEKAYQEAVDKATDGIEKDILLLERGDLQMAYGFYEKYLKLKQSLDDAAEIKLASLIETFFKKIPSVRWKNARKDKKGAQKYEKRLHVEKLTAAAFDKKQ